MTARGAWRALEHLSLKAKVIGTLAGAAAAVLSFIFLVAPYLPSYVHTHQVTAEVKRLERLIVDAEARTVRYELLRTRERITALEDDPRHVGIVAALRARAGRLTATLEDLQKRGSPR